MWADGTGNQTANALPKCRIQKILDSISQIPWSGTDLDESNFTESELNAMPRFFWIDTICVPLAPEDCKRRAIGNMSKTYKCAYQVLVLDADLMATPILPVEVSNKPCADVQVRIEASDWRWRAWTFQEAILAKRLWFQFRDQVTRQAGFLPGNSPDYYDDAVADKARRIPYDLGVPLDQLRYALQIPIVWTGLFGRCTSYPEDIPLCIAILLNLDVDQLTNIPSTDRHRKLWTMYPELHSLILCAPCARRPEPQL